MGDKPVVFRTLDIGGEKTLAYSDTTTEPNPELGLRSIRFTLAYRDIFEQQVRAILRAAAGRRITGHHVPPDLFGGRLFCVPARWWLIAWTGSRRRGWTTTTTRPSA
jgi:hypothetical protein